MCVPIFRSISRNLMNLENMQNRMFYLTSRDIRKNGMSYIMGATDTSDRFFDQEHFDTKSYGLTGEEHSLMRDDSYRDVPQILSL